MIYLSKRPSWNWLSDSDDSEEIHQVEWPWDKDDDEENHNDESYGADDYIRSRPWGIENDGY